MTAAVTVVRRWSACLGDQFLIDGKQPPAGWTALPRDLPKLLHRRLTPLAKLALQVAFACLDDSAKLPVVVSSAHGEISKSLALLKELRDGQELSPAAFSLSVHNAIAGLFSIACRNRCEMSVLAPASEGIAPAFIETLGMLREGAGEVLLICYDEPLPDFYPASPYRLSQPLPCALAMRLALEGPGLGLRFNRGAPSHARCRYDGELAVQLPAFVQFLLTQESALNFNVPGHRWTWQKLSSAN